MSTHASVEQDERTEVVMGESARLVIFFFLLALPIDMIYHLFVRHETAWDLLVIYVGGVVIGTVYQARHKTLGKSYWVMFAWIAAMAFVTVGVVDAMTQNTVWVWAVTGVVTGITATVVAAMRQAK